MKINNNFYDNKNTEIKLQNEAGFEDKPLFELSGSSSENNIEYINNDDGTLTAQLKDENGNVAYDVTVTPEGRTVSETTYLSDGNIDTYTEYDGSADKNVTLKSIFSYTYNQDGITVQCNSDLNQDNQSDTTDVWMFSKDGVLTDYKNTNDSDLDGVKDEEFEIEYDNDGNITGISSNFEIDGLTKNSKQGAFGDCYILSGLNNLSYSGKGRSLTEKSVAKNQDGSYNVEFQGTGDIYTITEDELALAREDGSYSSGDNTVLLFELAFEKALTNVKENPDNYPKEITDVVNADTDNLRQYSGSITDYGNLNLFTYFMTGENAQIVYKDENPRYVADAVKNFNAENEIININFAGRNGNDYKLNDINGNPVRLLSAHSWSLKNSDDDTATVVNPWNSSVEITFNKSELEQYIKFIEQSKIPEM